MSEQRMPDLVDDEEWLSRFIVWSRWIRADNTIRPDAFIPYPYPDLSVTRHRGLTISDIRRIAHALATKLERTLEGRADLVAAAAFQEGLLVKADPVLPENPNHAIIIGWPVDKPAQKIIAQTLAAAARFHSVSSQ